jgi:hypothetical protein
MCLNGPSCHFQLAGDFGVVTTLQKQFYNLLFTRTEPNGLLLHLNPLCENLFALADQAYGLTFPDLIASTMPF